MKILVVFFSFFSFFFTVGASNWFFEAIPVRISVHCCVAEYFCSKQCSIYYQEKICNVGHFALGHGCEFNGSLNFIPSTSNQIFGSHSGYRMGEFRMDRRRKIIGSEGVLWFGDSRNWKMPLEDRNAKVNFDILLGGFRDETTINYQFSFQFPNDIHLSYEKEFDGPIKYHEKTAYWIFVKTKMYLVRWEENPNETDK